MRYVSGGGFLVVGGACWSSVWPGGCIGFDLGLIGSCRGVLTLWRRCFLAAFVVTVVGGVCVDLYAGE